VKLKSALRVFFVTHRRNKSDLLYCRAPEAHSGLVTERYKARDLRSFVIRFDFESYVRFEIRFVMMVRFEIFESSALSIVIRKETIGGGWICV